MKYYKDDRRGNNNIELLIGILLLVIGLFIFSKKVYIQNSFITFRIGSMDLSSGLVTLPLILGVVWQFYNPRSDKPKLLMLIGGIIIVVSILMSIKISFARTTLFDYLLMFGLIGAGAGIILRALQNR